jgi:hypothetical protein
MAGLTGAGSFTFHTFATRWAELADTLPIWSFVAAFVLAAMHHIGGMAPRRVARIGAIIAIAAAASLFLASNEGVSPTPDPLNGSGQYAPALLALLIFAVLTAYRRHPAAPWIIAATGTFGLWHLLNGLMIAVLLQMLIRTGTFSRR